MEKLVPNFFCWSILNNAIFVLWYLYMFNVLLMCRSPTKPMTVISPTLRKKCLKSSSVSYFPAFGLTTERSISPYSVQISESTDENISQCGPFSRSATFSISTGAVIKNQILSKHFVRNILKINPQNFLTKLLAFFSEQFRMAASDANTVFLHLCLL